MKWAKSPCTNARKLSIMLFFCHPYNICRLSMFIRHTQRPRLNQVEKTLFLFRKAPAPRRSRGAKNLNNPGSRKAQSWTGQMGGFSRLSKGRNHGTGYCRNAGFMSKFWANALTSRSWLRPGTACRPLGVPVRTSAQNTSHISSGCGHQKMRCEP